MSDEYSEEEQWEEQDDTLDILDEVDELDDEAEASDEYEEISSEEVDRVVAALEGLMASTSSENIKTYLEESLTNIFCLIYEADDEEDENDGDVLCDAA